MEGAETGSENVIFLLQIVTPIEIAHSVTLPPVRPRQAFISNSVSSLVTASTNLPDDPQLHVQVIIIRMRKARSF